MQDKPRRKNFSLNHVRLGGLLSLLFLCPTVFGEELAGPKRLAGAVICRSELDLKRREELASKLRKISGWQDLRFDGNGVLRHGSRQPVAGSKGARELLTRVMLGTNAIVLEDVSRHANVAFMRVIPGQWKNLDGPPAFVVQIDFVDFDQLLGDKEALAAFDVGWALLHELDHVANDSDDAAVFGETGECEARINEMRLECNLPQRTDYFYTALPLTQNTAFSTKLMRLAFEQAEVGSTKKRRYWIVWDANLVGGLDRQNEVASLR
jgi:hypothetical protein